MSRTPETEPSPSPMGVAQRYLTEAQVAQLTGLSAVTLRCWRSRRTGPPFVKLGGAVRYPADRLSEWCESSPG